MTTKPSPISLGGLESKSIKAQYRGKVEILYRGYDVSIHDLDHTNGSHYSLAGT